MLLVGAARAQAQSESSSSALAQGIKSISQSRFSRHPRRRRARRAAVGALAIRQDWRRRRICWYIFSGYGVRELPMAKGQKRSAKEAKKPKANKPKTSVSDYKKSVIASGHK
jgi:hypothetical protein